ncbi:hypothetical protein [Larkinella soli]|uniref:hypothetical protein n=1 Tax=Larkinella soli TaxID=1770527 RepID=UPI000FFC2DA9|nr:hypothetical protein [Larkinella soli]
MSNKQSGKLKGMDAQIIDLYLSGLNQREVAERMGASRKAVTYVLKKNEVSIRSISKTDGIAEEIAKEYLSGKPLGKVAKLFGLSPMTIFNTLKRRNVPIRDRSLRNRRYAINEDFFDRIDTEEKAYFLGMLYADGYHLPEKNLIVLMLQQGDAELMERLNRLVYPDKPLVYGEERPKKKGHVHRYCKIQIKNQRMSGALERWGINARKTYNISFPDFIDPSLIHHFVRGFFDGDGWITNPETVLLRSNDKSRTTFRCTAGFIGHMDFIDPLREFLMAKCDVYFQRRISHPDGYLKIITILVGGRQQVLRLYNYMYHGATIYLQRKKARLDAYANRILRPRKPPQLQHKPIRVCMLCDSPTKKSLYYCRKHYNQHYYKKRRNLLVSDFNS